MTAAEHPLTPEDVMAYLDGELPAEQASTVRSHLAECDRCQRLSGDLRGVSRDLARWQIEQAPATLRVPSQLPRNDSRAWSGFGWLRGTPAAAFSMSAAAVVGVVVIASYGRLLVPSRAARVEAIPAYPASAPVPDARPPVRVGGAAGQMGSERTEAGVPAASSPRAQAPLQVVAAGPSIARVARLRVRTSEFDRARPVVDRVVAETAGLVGNVNVSGTRGSARALTATLLIPAARLDDALSALKQIGLVLEESQGGDDVTNQVIDLDARLSNARNTKKRLVDLLQKRTGDLADVLAAEREISRVREEIERFDAQRKALARRVTYATLNLEVVEEQQVALDLGPRPLTGRFRDAFVTGLTEAVDIALGLALLVVRVAPTLLFWIAVGVWPARAVLRWRRRQFQATSR